MVLKLPLLRLYISFVFENDVKMYGTQTYQKRLTGITVFENDVKMYGTQTYRETLNNNISLRMM